MNHDDNSKSSIQEFLLEIIAKSSQGEYIFRGESKCHPKISSTLYRQYEDVINTEHFDVEIAQKEMLNDVKKYTDFAEDTDILTELQHYGGNTNLIDFTTDYLIALFFACESSKNEDGRVILLSNTSRNYQIESPKKNQNSRVISQKSIFVRSPAGFIEDSHVVSVTIPGDLKREAMEHLKKHHGITPETIYNDFLGYIRNQERHHSAYAAFYIGYTCAENGDFEKAIAQYDETILLNPYATSAYRNRGGAKAELGRHKEAIADYDILLGFYPRDADAYFNRGFSNMGLGRPKAAIADFSEAIRIDPEHFEAYNNRGTANARLGLYEEAISDFDEAIRLNPEDAAPFNNRGHARSESGQVREAIVDYDEALRLNPEFASAFFNRGIDKSTLALYKEAIADLDQALRIIPEYAAALYYRGLAAKSLGRIDEAKENSMQARTLAEQQDIAALVLLSQQALDDLDSHEHDS